MKKLGQYKKTIAAVAIGAVGWATAVVQSPSGPITSGEWIAAGTGLLVALGVYSWANEKPPA